MISVFSVILHGSDDPALEASVDGAFDDMATGLWLCFARWSSRGHCGSLGEGYRILHHGLIYVSLRRKFCAPSQRCPRRRQQKPAHEHVLGNLVRYETTAYSEDEGEEDSPNG